MPIVRVTNQLPDPEADGAARALRAFQPFEAVLQADEFLTDRGALRMYPRTTEMIEVFETDTEGSRSAG